MMVNYHKRGSIPILFLTITAVGYLLVPFVVHSNPAFRAQAATITDLQKRKQQLEKKIKEDEANRKKKQEEQKKLQAQLKDIGDQMSGIEQKINETETTIGDTEQAIHEKEKEIAAKEQDLITEKNHQNETLRVIYETGTTSTLELLVGSESFSEVLVYHDYLDALEARIEKTAEDIGRTKKELEDTKAGLQGKKIELTELQVQQQAYREALTGQKKEKDRLLSDAKVVENRLATQISESQKVYADVNNELTRLMEAARKLAEQRARGQIPKGVSNVGFQFPTAFVYTSTYFGGRTPFQSFHTGLDLVNFGGTPVVSAADGVVTYIGRSQTYAYGNYVVITHNDRLATLYGHFQGFVSGLELGQKVSRGSLIGYMGTTGWSTGPHLHFEIREYGVPVDPMDYLP